MPAIFGMNFQAVSVGQKLIEKTLTPTVTGGYDTSAASNAVYGTPTPALLSEIQFVDAAIGEFVAALQKQHLSDSTLVIITAKHGQSPDRLEPLSAYSERLSRASLQLPYWTMPVVICLRRKLPAAARSDPPKMIYRYSG